MAKRGINLNAVDATIEKMKEMKEKSKRSPKTLYLSNKGYKDLKNHCEKTGVSVSMLLDQLIAAYLESVNK